MSDKMIIVCAMCDKEGAPSSNPNICLLCMAAEMDEKFGNKESKMTRNYRNGQCTATTKKGEQCKSGAQDHTTLCGPHEAQANRLLEAEHELDPGTEVLVREAQIANKEEKVEDKVATIFVPGHRPPKIGGYDWNAPKRKALRAEVEVKLLSAMVKFGKIEIIVGGALGADQDAAAVAYKLGVPYHVYAPCHSQDAKWPKAAQEIYARMLEKAASVTYVHDGPYNGAKCMMNRNKAMVDAADFGLSVYDGSPGGTANCLYYANRKGVKVANINPKNL